MKTFDGTLLQAQDANKDAIRIERITDIQWRIYVQGDALPADPVLSAADIKAGLLATVSAQQLLKALKAKLGLTDAQVDAVLDNATRL